MFSIVSNRFCEGPSRGFSSHCESSRRFVASSSVHVPRWAGLGGAWPELLLNPGSVMKYEPDNSSLGKFRKMFFDTPNIFQLN